MSKLLYIKASPRGERSHSIAVADAFIEAYRQENPDDEIMTIDLFKKELPAFDGARVNAKYAVLHGNEPTPEDKKAWAEVESIIEEFKGADKYVFAIPMWNFGIPYRLKQYIDLIVQPGYTFSFSPEKGYGGLMKGKPALVVYARGGDYAPGTPAEGMDMQKSYMDGILGFIGFEDIRSVIVEPMLAGGPDMASERQDLAIDEAKEMAESF